MRRRLNGPWGPVIVALGLAIVSVPIVAGALTNTGAPDYYPLPGPSFGDALILAAGACLGSAVVGGAFGGALLRDHRTIGPLVALGLAWPIAVGLVPMLAAASGIQYRSVVFCLDGCQVLIDSAAPLSGFGAVVQSFMGVVAIVPIAVFLGAVWSADRAARDGSNGMAATLVVIGVAALEWLGFLFAGATMFVPFVTLAIGVVIWASILGEPVPRTSSAKTAAHPSTS